MPNSTPDHKTDHRAEAEALLASATSQQRNFGEDLSPDEVRTIAVVHSNLAVAEELKGIREGLTGFDTSKIEGALIAEIEHVGREIIEIVWRANGLDRS